MRSTIFGQVNLVSSTAQWPLNFKATILAMPQNVPVQSIFTGDQISLNAPEIARTNHMQSLETQQMWLACVNKISNGMKTSDNARYNVSRLSMQPNTRLDMTNASAEWALTGAKQRISVF